MLQQRVKNSVTRHHLPPAFFIGQQYNSVQEVLMVHVLEK